MEELQSDNCPRAQKDAMEEAVQIKTSSGIIDLTGDGPYEVSAATVISAVKEETDNELPAYTIEGNMSDLEDDNWQWDENQRQQEAEASMQEFEQAAQSFQESLNFNVNADSGAPKFGTTAAEEPIVVDSDAEDAEAVACFQDKKDAYCRRANEGLTSLNEDIDYKRAEQVEEERLRRRQKNIAYQTAHQLEENAMFFPDHNSRSSPAPSRPEIPDLELVALMMASDSELEIVEGPSKGPGKGKNSSNKGHASKKVSNSRVKKSQPAKKGTGRGKKRGIEYTNIESLLRNNTIADAQANQSKGCQPTFKSKNKKDALAELISSLPEDQRSTHGVDKRELDNATRKFNGRGAMKADGQGGWLLRGMESSLTHFQLLGVGWMRDRENSSTKPYGGFVSDEMGLGKTVQAIANILDGRPLEKTKNGATLIVAPPALLSQWMREIVKHTKANSLGPVLVYRSGTRVHSSDPAATLSSHGVVITSYNEVLRSWPKNEPPPNLFTPRAKLEWYQQMCKDNKGDLHKVKWRRIVLDEAQAIKNPDSRTSEACCQLVGKYRWAMSGTPIQNRLEEFYAYWRFLELPHTGSYELFKLNFCKRGSELSMRRIQAYLAKFMLRRTHADQLFGEPILKLPGITSRTETVEFNHVEKAIYRIVRDRFVNKIKAYSSAEKEKKYQSIFVLLLRLRQLVGHVLLIQNTLKDLLEQPDLERLWSLTKDESVQSGRELLRGLEMALKSAHLGTKPRDADTGEQCSVNEHQPGDNTMVPSGPAHRFRKYLQSLRDDGKWAEINDRTMCQSCKSPPSNPHLTSCGHIVCSPCLGDLHWIAAINNENGSRCVECGMIFERAEPCISFEDAGNDRGTPISVRSGVRRGRAQSCEETDTDWFTLGGPVLQSAKTRATVEQIKTWIKEDDTAKIICFTQFRGLIKVLSRCCKENDWSHASFHGDMTFEARDRSIQQFSEDPKCKILLASLKAGGTGLNLTKANRVIIIDLWWNQSVETQAFCRVYRIGQERPVDLVRFVVKDSIDEDILRMQEHKNHEIDQAIETKHRPARLTTAELLALFGDMERNDEDEITAGGEDTAFVFADDPYEAVDD